MKKGRSPSKGKDNRKTTDKFRCKHNTSKSTGTQEGWVSEAAVILIGARMRHSGRDSLEEAGRKWQSNSWEEWMFSGVAGTSAFPIIRIELCKERQSASCMTKQTKCMRIIAEKQLKKGFSGSIWVAAFMNTEIRNCCDTPTVRLRIPTFRIFRLVFRIGKLKFLTSKGKWNELLKQTENTLVWKCCQAIACFSSSHYNQIELNLTRYRNSSQNGEFICMTDFMMVIAVFHGQFSTGTNIIL